MEQWAKGETEKLSLRAYQEFPSWLWLTNLTRTMRFRVWPGNFHMLWAQPQKKKKKKKKKGKKKKIKSLPITDPNYENIVLSSAIASGKAKN